MQYEFRWASGHIEEMEAETAFQRLSAYQGERVARIAMDQVRWDGGSWYFGGNKKGTVHQICFKPSKEKF